MSTPVRLFICILLALALCSLMPGASCLGPGVKAYVPSQLNVTANTLPFSYNGSFMVFNDGNRDGVYIIRVSVDDPSAINWVNVSEPAFTLRPGESKLVYFSFNVTSDVSLPGEHEFIFTPTLLTTNVEPYFDQFAKYLSTSDAFRFRLTLPGNAAAASSGATSGVPVVFLNDTNRTNLAQYSVVDNNTVVTLLDRAVKLNVQSGAIVGQPVAVSTSIFEGLSNIGVSLMAVSPDGSVYPINSGNYSFDRVGLWGVMVLMGDDIILGRTVDVTAEKSPLAGLDVGTILALVSLLALLSVVPVWLMAPRQRMKDPYEDIIFRAGVIKKYITRFDQARLKRAVQLLWNEYSDLVAKGAQGRKDDALKAINELNTLVYME